MKPPNVDCVKVVATLVDAARKMNRRAAEPESTEERMRSLVVELTARLERETAARAAKEAECARMLASLEEKEAELTAMRQAWLRKSKQDDVGERHDESGGASEARARPVVLPNGTYMLTPEQGVSVTLDVVASEARYRNGVGHYFADRDGRPICGRVDFTDAKGSIGGSATTDYALGEIPAEAVSVGIFIVPNGKELNPLLPDRAPVAFARNDRAHWAAYASCGPEAGPEAGPIHGEGAAAYFVDASLNHDMCRHTLCGHASGHASSSGAAAQEVGFEDLLGVGSDNEYRDVVVSVRLAAHGAARDQRDGGQSGDQSGDRATSATSVCLHAGAVRLADFHGVSLTSTSIGAADSGSDSDEARRHTSVGHYFADRDGIPIYARVDWVGFPTDTEGRPTYGSCVTYAPRDIPAGAETAGFFSVALRLAPSAIVAFAVDDRGLLTACTPRGEVLATVVFSDAPSWLRTSVSALPQDDERDQNARHGAAHAPHIEPPD